MPALSPVCWGKTIGSLSFTFPGTANGRFELSWQNFRWTFSFHKLWLSVPPFKVRLTPNIIFVFCNIWVILRRNVIYLYSKKPPLDQLFHCQSSRYDVIRWIFGTKNKGELFRNSPNDIISGNFDSEKVDQDGIFYCKDILYFDLQFFFEWPKLYCDYTHTKNYICA
jgi:hypothetical protein